MKHHSGERTICMVALVILSLATPVFGQARTTARWFDINPSQSNTDADNPNGASGGRVNKIGATADFSTVYAATEWGGLYQSFNQGATWVRVHSFSPSAAWDVKVDPRNNRRVYATSAFDGRVISQSGISISLDAGATWRPVNVPALNKLTCAVGQAKTEPTAWQIAISPVNTEIVFVGTNCGLARSTNAGGTWDFIDPSPADAQAEQIYAVVAQGPQIVDVIGDNGHFRSTNNGGNWSPVPAGPGPVAGNAGPRNSLAASPAESFVLLASDVNNIFESVDGGATWPTSLTLPLRNGQSNQQGRIPFIKTNQLSGSNQFDVWFGDVNLFRTTATTPSPSSIGGPPRTPLNAWLNVQNNGHWDVGDVLFDPRFASGACPSIFSSDGGVYFNTTRNNPACQIPNWDQPAITPHATWLWGMDGLRLLPGIHALTYGLQDNGGFAATNVIEGHNPPAPNWNNYTCCDVLHNTQGGTRMLSLQGASSTGRAFRLFMRDRDGSNGSEIPNYPTAQNFSRFESGNQNMPFGANGYVVNLADGVYATNSITSNPIAWTSLNSPLAATTGSGNLKIANLGGQPNVFYHTGNGNPESQGVLFRSTLVGATTVPPGTNWTAVTLPPGIVAATAWDVDPTNGNRAIISGINGATNNFEIWMLGAGGWNRLVNLETQMLGTTPAGNVFLNRTSRGKNTGTVNFGSYWQPSLFKFNPRDPTTIIAGAVDAGVFLSLDDGANWQLISNPINPTSNAPHIPRPLFAYFSPGRFAASTSAFDVWVGTRGAGVMQVVVETR
jgi:hypothetical protein